MVGIEELGSVGFSLRPFPFSRGRSSCARLGSSFSVLGPHFASFNGCFQVLVVLFSSFDAFWWRLNDLLLLLLFWPSASFSRPPSLTSLFCPRPILSLSSPPSFLTNPPSQSRSPATPLAASSVYLRSCCTVSTSTPV